MSSSLRRSAILSEAAKRLSFKYGGRSMIGDYTYDIYIADFDPGLSICHRVDGDKVFLRHAKAVAIEPEELKGKDYKQIADDLFTKLHLLGWCR